MIRKTVSPRFLLFILAGNKDIDQRFDEFEFRPNPTAYYKVTCTRASKIDVLMYSRLILIQSFFQVAGNSDILYILAEFKFRPDRTTECRVICASASKNIPITYNGESVVFNLIL